MKPKISPEEYRDIILSLDIDSLQLAELNTKFQEAFISPKLDLVIDEKNSFEQNNREIKIFYTYKLLAKDDSKGEPAVFIQAKYMLKYKASKDVVITKDFMKIFSELTLGMLLWTYFRELVNNMVYRMGMPPLVLPLKKR